MYLLVKIFLIVNLIHKIQSFCPVHLTISSKALSLKDATLVASWNPECSDLPSKVRFYSENPYLKETPALNEIYPKDYKIGEVDTNIKLENLELPQKWSFKSDDSPTKDSTCLNYYAISFNKSNHVINFNCLKINPQWMTNTKEFWSFPLKQLAIPGSKCSGCYSTERNSRRKHLKFESFHQNLDVWHQLAFGVRYLEFSVGYFRSFHKSLDIRSRFWIFNEEHEISPLFPVLEDILKFVELSNEIVILDFTNFTYGFHESSGAHEIFKKLLQNLFGHIAVLNNGKVHTKSYDFTIQQMRSLSKNIIILYNFDDLTIMSEQNESVLWPAWKRSEIKTDKNVANVLSSDISTKYRTDNSDGWILTAQYSNGNTDNINSFILSSLTGPWQSKVNVISLDYVFSTNLIDITLAVNHHKALSKRNLIVIDL